MVVDVEGHEELQSRAQARKRICSIYKLKITWNGMSLIGVCTDQVKEFGDVKVYARNKPSLCVNEEGILRIAKNFRLNHGCTTSATKLYGNLFIAHFWLSTTVIQESFNG